MKGRQRPLLERQLVAILKLPAHARPSIIRDTVADLYDRYVASAGTIAKLRQEVLELTERAKRAEEDARRLKGEADSAAASVQHVEEAWRRRLEEERRTVVDVVGVAVAAAAGHGAK